MSLIHKVHEKFYYPFFEGVIKKRNTVSYLNQMKKSQWFSTSELESLQIQDLNKLLDFSRKYSAFYETCLADTELPLKSLSDFQQVPVLTKDIIRLKFSDLITAPHRETVWYKSTGGSTGQPLHFGYTQESYAWRNAMSRRGYDWAGAGPGSKQAYIWGIQLGEVSKRQRLKEEIHHFIDRQKYFNCFNFGKKEMSDCLASLNKWQPQALIGYTNPLYEFALYVESVGGPEFKPQSVLCAAEKVHPFQREVLERVFDCPVFNTYGSREFMLIASECEKHEGLHISMENLLVEVVDDEGIPVAPGEVGRILVTDLHNYGMPFIRYEIGDMARVSERQCSCGRGLMLLDDIVGRSLDIIRTPEGRAVPGEFFPHLLKDYPQILRFQVKQKSLNALTVKYQLLRPLPHETMQQIVAEIRNILGTDMQINFDEVSEIPLTATGKYRVTISELDQ